MRADRSLFKIGYRWVWLPTDTLKTASLKMHKMLWGVLRNRNIVMYKDKVGWHIALYRDGDLKPFWYIPTHGDVGIEYMRGELLRGARQMENYEYIIGEMVYNAGKREEQAREDFEEEVESAIKSMGRKIYV